LGLLCELTRNNAEWPGWPEVRRVNRLGLATDLAHRRAGFRHKDMTETFASFTHGNDALIVWRPANILDGSCNGLELIFKQVLLVDRVPNANLAGGVW